MARWLALFLLSLSLMGTAVPAEPFDAASLPYLLTPGITSRSISFENPTGGKGEGGKASSNLGVGRKGAPAKHLAPGEVVELCDIAGPGVIRRIWMTTRQDTENLRGLVVRAYWEGQEHPSIECPLGDFMGFAHGKVAGYGSAVHSVGPKAGMNFWLPMPFAKRARLTLTNEMKRGSRLFYQIDYTLGEAPSEPFGRMHVLFRRENPTIPKQDFEILPKRMGSGRYIGCVLGIRALSRSWWGEGEVKIFLDGDTEFPTICGTGSEDYVGLSWGVQDAAYPYNGCNYNREGYVSMYRWHLPDPVFWKQDIQVTIQQLAWIPKGYADRKDDWSTATFWYEPVPSEPLPPFPSLEARTADLPADASMAEPVGKISPLEAIHLVEREIERFRPGRVESSEEAGVPVYMVSGESNGEGAEAWVDAKTAKVLVIAREGGKPEYRGHIVPVGHRGAMEFAPENTLASFRKAIDLGAELVEMDVRQTKDGELVLCHDASVDRTTDGSGRIVDLTLKEIKQLDAGSSYSEEFKGERIPTFAEALEAIRGRAAADIDLKSASIEKLVAVLHAEEQMDPDFFKKATLHCDVNQALKQVIDQEPRLRIRPTLNDGELGLAAFLAEFNPPIVNLDWRVFTEEVVRKIHLAGKKAFVNTLGRSDSEVWMAAAIDAGADFVQTDHLDVLAPLIKRKALKP
jgi:glycerophosphoryl diester phosphodiesterase